MQPWEDLELMVQESHVFPASVAASFLIGSL